MPLTVETAFVASGMAVPDDAPTLPSPVAPLTQEPEEEAPPVVCPNCGGDVVVDYCARCGQENAPLRQPVHRFVGESLVEYFGVDGRLWNSLVPLLFRPGRLTQEYLAGRRVRYLRPLRLYLTATLFFFFLLAALDPVSKLGEFMGQGDAEADTTVAVADRIAALDSALAALQLEEVRQMQLADSLREVLAAFKPEGPGVTSGLGEDVPGLEATEEALAEVEEELADLREGTAPRRRRRLAWERDLLATWPPDSLIRAGDLDRAAELIFPGPRPDINVGLPSWLPRSEAVERMQTARTGNEVASAAADFGRAALGQMPTVMFLLLPFFALLLKLVYVRRDWYYSEHLVFALHTHAFAFLVFALVAVLLGFSGGAAWAGTAAQVLLVLLPVYFFVAQKRVYGQGWVKTGLKALVLGWLYGFAVLALGLTLAIVLAAILG